MPIATKNGSLIVKDGKLAESCGCCCLDLQSDAAAITVALSLCAGESMQIFNETPPNCAYQDSEAHWSHFSGEFRCLSGAPATRYIDEWFFVQQFNGVFTLSRTSADSTEWQYVTHDAAGCQSRLVLTTVGNKWTLKISGRQVAIESYLGNSSDRPTFQDIDSCEYPASNFSACKSYYSLPNGGQYENTLATGSIPCFSSSRSVAFSFSNVYVGKEVMFFYYRLSGRALGTVTFGSTNPLP